MFKFLGKKAPDTFKSRVEQFWIWFSAVAPRFYATIEDKKCAELTQETSAKLHELFADFAWAFGPGDNHVGHSFTLSGEGGVHKQLLPLFWKSQAPTVPGWTFYAARRSVFAFLFEA